MIYLSAKQIILINSILADEMEEKFEIRDHAALSSIADQPRRQFLGQDWYSTIFLKAASYFKNLLTKQPFAACNHQTALTTAVTFLALNGYKFTTELNPASFRQMTNQQLAKWLRQHSQPS